MKIRYLVKWKGKQSTHPVYIALYDGDMTELVFTGERIARKDWSVVEMAPKDQTGDIYSRIEKVRAKVQKTLKLLEAQDLPTTPYTIKDAYQRNEKDKSLLQSHQDKKEKQNSKTVCHLANRWVDMNLFAYKPSTQKAVKESVNQFKEFLKVSGQASLERKQLSMDIITSYERFLQERKKLSNSTHGKRIKHLRWFLKSIDFDIKSIKLRSHKKTIVALTMEELIALENVDVSANSMHQKAKDLFLLGCYTGLRISDLKRLNQTRIVNDEIRLSAQKTGKELEIPLIPACKAILTKYGYTSPKITEQDLNENIKEVCRQAGITTLVSVEKNVASLNVTTQEPKFKLISSHISGKTFITLAGPKWGLDPAEIAAIVGKDLKTLLNHYFQLPRDSAKQKMIAAEASSQMKIAQ